MSETLPEGITRQEFNELQEAVRELADSLRAQRDAETATERQEANAEVKDAKADLETLAKEMGVPVAKLRAAAENAKREEELEKLRPLVMAILDEEIEKDDQTPDDEEKPDDEPEEEKPEPEEETPEPEPAEDTAPTQEHWSERSIGELLGR